MPAIAVTDSFFFFQAEDGIRDYKVTGVQTCALPISAPPRPQPDWKLWATGFLPSETTGTPPHFRRRDQICELTRSSRASGGPISRITAFSPAWPSLAARRIPEAPPPTITTSTFSLATARSEEHTSELQSPCNLVCRL